MKEEKKEDRLYLFNEETKTRKTIDFQQIFPMEDYYVVEIYPSAYEGRGGSGKVTHCLSAIQKGGQITKTTKFVGAHTPYQIAFWAVDGVAYRTEEVSGNEKIVCAVPKAHLYSTGIYLLVTTKFAEMGPIQSRVVKFFHNLDEAGKAFFTGAHAENKQLDLFCVTDGAELIASTASIQDDTNPLSTGFSCYDYGYNPYDACSHKCTYCYGCILKDNRCLPSDLTKRVAIGTHTDPYQKREKKDRKTHKLLNHLLRPEKNGVTKVGIFTKSPLVVHDLDLISKLPNPSIHLNLSPFSAEIRKRLEPGAPSNSSRIAAAKKIKEAGVRLVLNICPCMPSLSEEMIGKFHTAYELADEICVGLTCLYGSIPTKLAEVVGEEVVRLMRTDWDIKFMERCREVFQPYVHDKLVIWRDTDRKGWKNLLDAQLMPQEFYTS